MIKIKKVKNKGKIYIYIDKENVIRQMKFGNENIINNYKNKIY